MFLVLDIDPEQLCRAAFAECCIEFVHAARACRVATLVPMHAIDKNPGGTLAVGEECLGHGCKPAGLLLRHLLARDRRHAAAGVGCETEMPDRGDPFGVVGQDVDAIGLVEYGKAVGDSLDHSEDVADGRVAQESGALVTCPTLQQAELTILAQTLEAPENCQVFGGEVEGLRALKDRPERPTRTRSALVFHMEHGGGEIPVPESHRFDEQEAAPLRALTESLAVMPKEPLAVAMAVMHFQRGAVVEADRHRADLGMGQEPSLDDDLFAAGAATVRRDAIAFHRADDMRVKHRQSGRQWRANHGAVARRRQVADQFRDASSRQCVPAQRRRTDRAVRSAGPHGPEASYAGHLRDVARPAGTRSIVDGGRLRCPGRFV